VGSGIGMTVGGQSTYAGLKNYNPNKKKKKADKK